MAFESNQTRLLVAILAAGASRRLGQPKQLVLVDGEPLLRRQCRMALEAAIGRVAVILGYRADECAATIVDLPVERHINEQWAEGLGASIRTAARTAVAANVAGLLLLHADQYRLTPADLHSLNAAWHESVRSSACVSVSDGESGPPVIFPRSCFADLLFLAGDTGARGLLTKLPEGAVQRVALANAFFDFDSIADLASLTGEASRLNLPRG